VVGFVSLDCDVWSCWHNRSTSEFLSGRTTSWMCYPFILQSNMHLDFMLTVFRKWGDKFSSILLGLLQFF
jgi:hypothetical protein